MKQLKFRKIDIETYKPGKSRIGNIKNLIKLSANESALGFSSKIKINSFNNKKIDKSDLTPPDTLNLHRSLQKIKKNNSYI